MGWQTRACLRPRCVRYRIRAAWGRRAGCWECGASAPGEVGGGRGWVGGWGRGGHSRTGSPCPGKVLIVSRRSSASSRRSAASGSRRERVPLSAGRTRRKKAAPVRGVVDSVASAARRSTDRSVAKRSAASSRRSADRKETPRGARVSGSARQPFRLRAGGAPGPGRKGVEGATGGRAGRANFGTRAGQGSFVTARAQTLRAPRRGSCGQSSSESRAVSVSAERAGRMND